MLLGRFTVCRFDQSSNIYSGMRVTPAGMDKIFTWSLGIEASMDDLITLVFAEKVK